MENKLKFYDGTLTLFSRNDKVINCTIVSKETVYSKDINLTCLSANTGIYFEDCIMNAIPSAESIKRNIPNLTVLCIRYSKLSKITAEDLKGFDCLRDLYVTFCEIEYLPGDLFKHTLNLEIIKFIDNKIKYIDEGILEPLQNLKIFNLSGNMNIDVLYDVMNNEGNVTLAQLKNEMMTKCSRTNLKKVCDDQQQEIEALKANDEHQKKEIAELNQKFVTLSSENEKSKKMCMDLEKKLETVLQQFEVIKQVSNDFTIRVNEKHFMVSKAVLIAHSPVLAKLITDNPEADDLELKDISEATFQEILNFMNDGSRLNEDANMIELYGASCRLKIEALTAIVAEVLKEEVNQDNALDVLVLCNKFNKLNRYHELKAKAFAEFQKNFPLQNLIPELASQPEKLKKLMQAKLEMDKVVAEMHQVD